MIDFRLPKSITPYMFNLFYYYYFKDESTHKSDAREELWQEACGKA